MGNTEENKNYIGKIVPYNPPDRGRKIWSLSLEKGAKNGQNSDLQPISVIKVGRRRLCVQSVKRFKNG